MWFLLSSDSGPRYSFFSSDNYFDFRPRIPLVSLVCSCIFPLVHIWDTFTNDCVYLSWIILSIKIYIMGSGGDFCSLFPQPPPNRWELPIDYPVFTVVMVIYHYVDRIWRIRVTLNFPYNIYDHEKTLSRWTTWYTYTIINKYYPGE